MQFAGGGMTIMNGREMIAGKNIAKVASERRQVLCIDCSVLNDGHWFGVPRCVGQQAQCGFAEVPDAILGCAPNDRIMVSEAGSAQLGLKSGRSDGYGLARACRKLDREDGSGVSFYEKAVLPLLQICFGAFENITVDQLTRTRRISQSHKVSTQGLVNCRTVYTDKRTFTGWQRLTPQRDFS